MPVVNNVYVYTNPANPVAPPAPLLGPVNGTFNVNLYQLPAPTNAAGIVPGNVYMVCIGEMSRRNRGSPGTCNGVAPPSYIFVV